MLWTSKREGKKTFTLTGSSISLLQAGLTLSQSLQKAIVRSGTTIIDDRMVKTLKTFRLIVLKENPDMALFLHPLTLSKLAMFMITAMRETGRSYLPFVIAALNPKTDSYLIVGMDSNQSNSKQR